MKTGLLLVSLALLAPAAAQAQAEMEHRYADVNGIRLHYVTKGQGPVILFIHGFPEFWYAWKPQVEEFSRDHQAVAVDLRGYNLSSRPKEVEQYAIPLLVADIQALADHLLRDRPRKKLTLVGHDWGGVVAWVFAMVHPEYLDRFVAINSPHPAVFQREIRENPAQQKASSYMVMFRSEQAEAALSANNYEALARAVFEGSAKPEAFSEEDRRAYREAWSQPGALTGGLNYYRASRAGPPPPNAATAAGSAAEPAAPLAQLPTQPIRVPTLVIWGEKDRALLTGNLDGLDAHVTDLRIRRIPAGTHWVVHEFPAEIHAYIREFMKDKAPGK